MGLTIWSKDFSNHVYQNETSHPDRPDRMVAYFSMVHVGVWILVGIFDRYDKFVLVFDLNVSGWWCVCVCWGGGDKLYICM